MHIREVKRKCNYELEHYNENLRPFIQGHVQYLDLLVCFHLKTLLLISVHVQVVHVLHILIYLLETLCLTYLFSLTVKGTNISE